MTIFLIVVGILITSILLLMIFIKTVLSNDGRIEYVHRFMKEDKLNEILVVMPSDKFYEQLKNFKDIKIEYGELVYDGRNYQMTELEAATVLTFSSGVHQTILKIRRISPEEKADKLSSDLDLAKSLHEMHEKFLGNKNILE